MTEMTSMPDPLEAWTDEAIAAVRRVGGVGPAIAARVRAAFPSPAALLAAPVERLVVRVPGVNNARAAAVRWELMRYADRAGAEMYRRATAGGLHVPSVGRGGA